MTKCVCMCVRSVKSDSLQPYGLYSSRLFCPCDFRGKNTWTGCHFLLQGIFPAQDSNPHLSFSALAGGFFTTMSPEKPLMTVWSESEGHSAVSDSLQPHGLYSPWNSPGQNTGVGNLCLLQGIFPTQGVNPGLPRCRQILYQLSHRGNPMTMWLIFKYILITHYIL